MEAEAVWHLVVPSGTRCMFKEQFVRARYILKGLSEGRSMPPNFPEHVYKERIPLPRVGAKMTEAFGAFCVSRAMRRDRADACGAQAPRSSRSGTTSLRTWCGRSWRRSTARAT